MSASKAKRKHEEGIGELEDFHVCNEVEDHLGLSLANKLSRKTINKLTEMLSGSKITHEQFHLLRVIWPLMQRRSGLIEDLHKYGLLQAWGVASGILDSSAEFKKFLNHLDGGEPVQHLAENDTRMPGSFWAISRYQDQITSPICMTSTAPTLAPTFPTPKMTLWKCEKHRIGAMLPLPSPRVSRSTHKRRCSRAIRSR